MTTICAFCGPTTSPISPEDIWPRWLVKYLRQSNNNMLLKQRVEWLKTGGVEEEHGIQRPHVDAYVVCQACNTGWMSETEELVGHILKPLVSDPAKPRDLSDEDALTIALWLAIKSVVVDHYSILNYGQTKPFFTFRQRLAMAKESVPPRNAWIYVGRLDPHIKPINSDFQTLYYSRLRAQGFSHLGAYVFTLSINEVVLQLIAIRSATKRGMPDDPPYAVDPSRLTWPDLVAELWPTVPTALYWPPPHQLSRKSFDVLTNRIGGWPPLKPAP